MDGGIFVGIPVDDLIYSDFNSVLRELACAFKVDLIYMGEH
jgi:hypothetical protein